PFGHFLARLFDALELLLPLDELVLAWSCHITYSSCLLPVLPSPPGLLFFRRKKTPKPFIAGSGVGETAKTKSESAAYISLPAADVKD
ncbi:MAG: hypothetical protein Q8M88_02005, partial [Phenylobacterium sp.]|uniref:hypothetical protein n=1 Tax=Phenylobacterium sp. TaxID=1871053 RepID=UPI0027363CB2